MDSARPIRICWSDQSGASGAKSVTNWRRQNLWGPVEGHARIACSNVCGAYKERGQVMLDPGCPMSNVPLSSSSQNASGGGYQL